MSHRDTHDKILGADDLLTSTEDVPEWGTKIALRGMTGLQRIDLVDKSGSDRSHMYADILIATCYDIDDGKLIFTSADRDALMGKSGTILERLALVVIQELSGVSVDDAEKEVAADPTSVGA